MNHLEQLVYEYYEWKGYIVRKNIKVGKLKKGGWEMELDIVAYHPITNHLIQVEPSIDGDSWEKRRERFEKKFQAGKKYIYSDVMPWLSNNRIQLEQVALLVTHPEGKNELAGGRIISLDEFIVIVKAEVQEKGIVSRNAIPESYPLLRTIQLVTSGYFCVLNTPPATSKPSQPPIS